MAAQYSLPHALAAALVYGPRAIEGYDEAAMANPAIQVLADRVEAETDAEMEAAFPIHFGSTLTLEIEGAPSRRVAVLDSLGTPAKPMTRAALIAKFDQLVAPTGVGLSGAAVAEHVEQMKNAATLDALIAPFQAEAKPT
jgi:2-methylcitrate dehydratase PrpD